jgi:hypothetical protein
MIILFYASSVILRTAAYSNDMCLAARRNCKVILYLGRVMMCTQKTPNMLDIRKNAKGLLDDLGYSYK